MMHRNLKCVSPKVSAILILSGILWPVASAIASSNSPLHAPPGAKILTNEEIRRLVVGHSIAGPNLDNSPSAVSYNSDGSYSYSASGVVPIFKRGIYRIVRDQLCTIACFSFARTQSGRYLQSASVSGHTVWMPVRIIR
jgi:hypothetical protein